jgi:hypothetical protein
MKNHSISPCQTPNPFPCTVLRSAYRPSTRTLLKIQHCVKDTSCGLCETARKVHYIFFDGLDLAVIKRRYPTKRTTLQRFDSVCSDAPRFENCSLLTGARAST